MIIIIIITTTTTTTTTITPTTITTTIIIIVIIIILLLCCIYFNCSITQIHQMIIAYDHIVLLRDRLAGCLRGFLLFSFTRKKNYTIFYVSSGHDNCILSNVTCLFRNNISKNIVVEICRL